MNAMTLRSPGLSPADADLLRSLVERHTGVLLVPEHSGLLEARLSIYLRGRKGESMAAIIAAARAAPEGAVARELAEVLTNGETSFFRDPLMFEELREWVLPELAARQDRLELWCAACATGQEPYSLALLIATWFPELLEPGRLRIIASDVSRPSLAYADRAAYTRAELNRGLPAPMLVRWFEPVASAAGERERWRLDRAIRNLVELRQINLFESWRLLPPMDLILIRNVMLYWSPERRAEVVARLPEQLAPNGYVALGGAEMLGTDAPLTSTQRKRWRFYQRRPQGDDHGHDHR